VENSQISSNKLPIVLNYQYPMTKTTQLQSIAGQCLSTGIEPVSQNYTWSFVWDFEFGSLEFI